MPRPPRLSVPNGIYHVISRGVKQSPIFRVDRDRWDFLSLIRKTYEKDPFILHDYCLMGNHYHLLLQPLAENLSKIMQRINSVFSNRFNKRHGVTGHVLQGRFHSIPVETDAYLTTVSRYIHLNPVRAGLVSRPEDYRWSNYHSMITGTPNPLTDHRFVLGYFGCDAERQAQAYRTFVEDGIKRPEPITEKVLWRMRLWGNPLARKKDVNRIGTRALSQANI